MRYMLKTQLFVESPPHLLGFKTLFSARLEALLAWVGGCEVIEIHDLQSDEGWEDL